MHMSEYDSLDVAMVSGDRQEGFAILNHHDIHPCTSGWDWVVMQCDDDPVFFE